MDNNNKVDRILQALRDGDFPVSTTHFLEGRPVKRYLGVVAGEAVLGTNVVRDMFAKLRNITGGRTAGLEKELERARQAALAEMALKAVERGGNAVIGVDIDYDIAEGPIVFVSVNGTAVEVEE